MVTIVSSPPRERGAIFKKRSKGEGLEVFNVKGRRGLVEKICLNLMGQECCTFLANRNKKYKWEKKLSFHTLK